MAQVGSDEFYQARIDEWSDNRSGVIHLAGNSPIDAAARKISKRRHITVDELLPRRRDPRLAGAAPLPLKGERRGKWLDDLSPTGRCPMPMEVVRHSSPPASQPPPTAANDNWPKVVAFTGLAGSGKSTAADYLVERGYVRVKFAGPLKAMMRAIGLTEDHIEGDLKEVPTPLLAGRTPRYAMQTIGTDWGRELIGPTLWTGLWHATVSDVLDHGGRVVCDDCRFANEADVVRGVGGVVVRIYGRGGISGGHASETMEFEADRCVANISNMTSLRRRIDWEMSA